MEPKMQTRLRFTTFGTLLLSTLLASCANTGGMVSSLEDISTESQKEGMFEARQYRVASIPGWLNFPEVGELFFYKPTRKPTSTVGISQTGKSYFLSSEIPADKCDEKQLIEIRNKIIAASEGGKALVSQQLQRVLLQGTKTNSENAGEALSNAESTAASKFDQAYNDALKSINNKGVFIYRWNTASKKSGSLGVDSLLSVSGSKGESTSGFAVVCGARFQTLYIGHDLLEQWPELNRETSFDNNYMLITGLIQGKHIVYGNMVDVESYASASLSASAEELSTLPATLQKATKIKIEATLARIANLSNSGVMSGITRTIKAAPWQKCNDNSRLKDDDGWETIFTVASEFREVIKMLSPLKTKGDSKTPDFPDKNKCPV